VYANIAFWVKGGWIEIGQNEYSQSFVRALDEGGLVWEGEAEYSSFHQAFQALDAGIAAWRGGKDCEGEAESAGRDAIATGTSTL